MALKASEILFNKKDTETLHHIDEATLLSVFEGVPQFEISRESLEAGIPPLDFLTASTQIFPSKGEARKTMKSNGVSLNKEKFTDFETPITSEKLLNNKYILVQKGKKNYYLVVIK